MLTTRRIPQHEDIRELSVHARPSTGDEWWRLLPRGTSGDAGSILTARGLRSFADGFVSLLLPIYLVELGFSALAIGAIVTSTLIGTALLTLWVEIGRASCRERG